MLFVSCHYGATVPFANLEGMFILICSMARISDTFTRPDVSFRRKIEENRFLPVVL